MLIKKILSVLCLLMASAMSFAQTYRNPVLNADVPDVSVVKVADTYYMVSTTMHLMPGCPVMASKDMINWKTISYVFDRIDDGPRYNLEDGATVYGQGQWASSIRYVKNPSLPNGKFFVWFTANGAPGKGFVFSADKAEGPWSLVARPPHMHDGSILFDDDGKVYMYHETGHLTELRPDLQGKLEGGVDMQVFERDAEERGSLLEGSSAIKHNGKYYLCMISMKWGERGRVRREVCYRADKITGPYEKKVILETPFETHGGVGQGCLAGDADSDEGWQALIFQDRGGIGRTPCLVPVTWVDGWPMCGEYTGEINADIKDTPDHGDNLRLDKRAYRTPSDMSKAHPSPKGYIGSDEFDGKSAPMATSGYHAEKGLSLYWQWNHNPIDNAWSLTERPGFLRLKTARVVDNLNVAPNTITQRMFAPQSTGTVSIDLAKMKDGDICGFAAYNGDSGVLRVVKKGKKYVLQLTEEKSVFTRPRNIERVDVEVIEEVPLKVSKKNSTIYLRIHGDFNPGRDMASFSYSMDNKQWSNIGREVKMSFDYQRHFMGTKFAIFNFATKQVGGYVDVDWFHFEEN